MFFILENYTDLWIYKYTSARRHSRYIQITTKFRNKFDYKLVEKTLIESGFINDADLVNTLCCPRKPWACRSRI